jgi:hypothetical protein
MNDRQPAATETADETLRIYAVKFVRRGSATPSILWSKTLNVAKSFIHDLQRSGDVDRIEGLHPVFLSDIIAAGSLQAVEEKLLAGGSFSRFALDETAAATHPDASNISIGLGLMEPPEAKAYVDLRIAVSVDDRLTQNIRFRVPAGDPSAQDHRDILLDACKKTRDEIVRLTENGRLVFNCHHHIIRNLADAIDRAEREMKAAQAT